MKVTYHSAQVIVGQFGVPAGGGFAGEGSLSSRLGGGGDEVAVAVVAVPPLVPLPERRSWVTIYEGVAGAVS